MRILLTGASSFTGYWFARQLALAGHEIVAVFRGEADSYGGARGRRVTLLKDIVEPAWNCVFGTDRFLALLPEGRFDLLCHHAAEMDGYRSWDFDWIEASRRNTFGARDVLTRLASQNVRGIVLTGSVFEPYEGVGDPDHRAFSPYGLAKHVSFEAFRLEAQRLRVPVGKFVIPNPFGPLEEARFTSYLAGEWGAGRVPVVKTPDYVRDNIPVSHLALAYASFCAEIGCATTAVLRATPSGYVGSQYTFALRVAREIGRRAGRDLDVVAAQQTDFSEPMTRINAASSGPPLDWSETASWDALYEYYASTFHL